LGLPGVLGARLDRAVVRVDEDTARRPLTSLRFGHQAETGDDHDVTLTRFVRRSAVDTDHPRAALPGERVGLEALTVGNIPDVDLLIGDDVRPLQQLNVDGDAAFVVQIGAGHGGAVYLAAKHGAHSFTSQRSSPKSNVQRPKPPRKVS